MDLMPVTCNNCGAALQVPESARFVTCRYCHSQLQINRTESSITTEVLQRIDQKTTAMADDLHALRRDAEIERLDREWKQKRDSYLIRGKNGNVSTPTVSGGIIGAIVMGAFGIFWTIMAYNITAPHEQPDFPNMPGFPVIHQEQPESFQYVHIFFPLFGMVFVIAAIALGIKTASDGTKLEQEQRRYERRRQQLLDRTADSQDSSENVN